jgi:hypothetical protein
MQIVTGPADAAVTFLFAHGAGAPMDSDFMNAVAEGLSAKGLRVVRFEFPYMAARRKSGKGGTPDRSPVLLATFKEVFQAEKVRAGSGGRVAVGGKSMGGRIASMICDEVSADACVCFGYPFWPPQKKATSSNERIRHLESLRTRALILQGTRDSFGGEEPVRKLSIAPQIAWLPDGDHDFAPRKRSGHTHEENIARAIAMSASFLLSSA